MAKIVICDICKLEGILKEAHQYTRVPGRSELRIDYCEECKPKIPKGMNEYTKLAYKIIGVDASDEMIETMNKFHRGK